MFNIFDIRDNYSNRFADYLNGVERFCPVIDKNILLSIQSSDGEKKCSNYNNCQKKDTCKIIKQWSA